MREQIFAVRAALCLVGGALLALTLANGLLIVSSVTNPEWIGLGWWEIFRDMNGVAAFLALIFADAALIVAWLFVGEIERTWGDIVSREAPDEQGAP